MIRSLLLFSVLLLPPINASASVWSWFQGDLQKLEKDKAALGLRLEELPKLPAPQSIEHVGFHSGFAQQEETVRWMQLDLKKEQPIDSVVVVPAFFGSEAAYGFPPRFRVDASNDPAFGDSITLLDHTDRDYQPTLAPLCIRTATQARYLRFTATKLRASSNGRTFFFSLGELLVFSDHSNIAARAPLSSSLAVESPPTWSAQNLVDGVSALGIPTASSTVKTNGWHSGISNSQDKVQWVQIDLGAAQALQEVRLIPAHPPDFPDRTGFGFPLRFKVEASDEATFAEPHLIFDATAHDFANPGDNPVPLLAMGITGRFLRITANKLWERSGDYVFALGEVQIFADGKNLALRQPVSSLDATLSALWKPEYLVDGLANGGSLVDWEPWLAQLSTRHDLEQEALELSALETAAQTVAQHRAMGWAAAGAVALVAFFLIGVQKNRRARRREIETLRESIARDLHDEVGSHLGSISLASELALRTNASPDDARASLDEIHRMARQAAESMRGIVWLVREGGEPTLERLIQALRESAAVQMPNIPWELHTPDQTPKVSASLDFHRHVFLFFKEALHNITRHAQATSVQIIVHWTTERFQLTITDYGLGFDPARTTDGSGLKNMKHRATALQGSLEITSVPLQGTTITLTVPLH
ncbi:hypothetical protein BH11VER1_BH11VER1_21440 [soil metagenome]